MGEQAAPSDMAALTELIMKMRNEQLEIKQDLARIMRKEEEQEQGEHSKKKEEESDEQGEELKR